MAMLVYRTSWLTTDNSRESLTSDERESLTLPKIGLWHSGAFMASSDMKPRRCFGNTCLQSVQTSNYFGGFVCSTNCFNETNPGHCANGKRSYRRPFTGLAGGFQMHVPKPIDEEELTTVITAVIGGL